MAAMFQGLLVVSGVGLAMVCCQLLLYVWLRLLSLGWIDGSAGLRNHHSHVPSLSPADKESRLHMSMLDRTIFFR